MTKQQMIEAEKRLSSALRAKRPEPKMPDVLSDAEREAYESAVRSDLGQLETAILLLEKAADSARELREMLRGVTKLAEPSAARIYLEGRITVGAYPAYDRARRCLELAHRNEINKAKEARHG